MFSLPPVMPLSAGVVICCVCCFLCCCFLSPLPEGCSVSDRGDSHRFYLPHHTCAPAAHAFSSSMTPLHPHTPHLPMSAGSSHVTGLSVWTQSDGGHHASDENFSQGHFSGIQRQILVLSIPQRNLGTFSARHSLHWHPLMVSVRHQVRRLNMFTSTTSRYTIHICVNAMDPTASTLPEKSRRREPFSSLNYQTGSVRQYERYGRTTRQQDSICYELTVSKNGTNY